MRLSYLLAGAASAALLAGCASTANIETEPVVVDTPPVQTEIEEPSVTLATPVAKRELKTIEQVGRTRVDPYNWMKDDNWQQVMQDPTVLRA
ncbi:MAG: S9 family peptidase, partial [Alphaproteobacteria bacterium]|nr:S9 family peptidase [Alphaproteobacteria bacterium]